MDDVKGARCHCEKCRKYSASDLNLMVMNEMIKRLRTEIADARLCYLAYCDYMPVPTGIKPEKGIFLQYAPFERDFTKGAVCMSEGEKQNITDLLEFFGYENATVLEYWYDNSMFSGWEKPPKKFVPDNYMIKKILSFIKTLASIMWIRLHAF